MQRICTLLFIIIVSFIVFSSCRKNDNPDPNSGTTVVNDQVLVNASISGIVLNESNQPVADAVVTSGTSTTTTK